MRRKYLFILLLTVSLAIGQVGSVEEGLDLVLDSKVNEDENFLKALWNIKSQSSESTIKIKQPLWKNYIFILLYDPLKRDEKSLVVSISEGSTKGFNKKFSKQVAVSNASLALPGVFIGKCEISGSHSTPVIARYSTKDTNGNSVDLDSGLLYMAFH